MALAASNFLHDHHNLLCLSTASSELPACKPYLMPQIYAHSEPSRRRSLSSSSSSSSSSGSAGVLRPFDADDSIVLSDLLRTGEASRLRRRGAMRIDHNATTNTAGVPTVTRNLVLVERPNWDSDVDFDISPQPDVHLGRTASLRYPRRRQRMWRYGPYNTGAPEQEESDEEVVYTLVCGAETADCTVDDFEPFKPSVLPLYPPPPPAKAKDTTRSSGCGAVIHMRAAPRPRVGVWSAHGAASDAVVPLDASYFDTREAAKIVRSKCGCISEGVGCSIWYDADSLFILAETDFIFSQRQPTRYEIHPVSVCLGQLFLRTEHRQGAPTRS